MVKLIVSVSFLYILVLVECNYLLKLFLVIFSLFYFRGTFSRSKVFVMDAQNVFRNILFSLSKS